MACAVTLRDKPQREQQVGAGSVSAFAAQLPLGIVWVLCGVCSYGLLSVASRCLLHSEQAAWHWRVQVPTVVYDRSLFMFATAFLIDILTICFEYKSSRLDMVLLPAFIKGMATVTNILVRYGWGTVGEGPGGSMVMVQRYICWMHTTPTILLLVRMISTSITKQQVVRAVLCVEVMLITGLAGALCSGWLSALWGLASHLAFLPLLPYLHKGLSEAGCIVSLHAAGHTMTLVYYITMMMWVTFGLVWDLRMLGFLSTDVEEVVYLCCDFVAKVMFSSGLMLSSFKGMENRREGVMRQIQETHRQTLIQELKRVIEQKDAFMSSVSHELRTPLNGIIGISEGLLSGCCGILNESVRRQIYIVRTSGARLLALINDVMDAAALRQHRLVLKQERLDLRQVVGDVSDLTRSLVDNDVTLRNDVPEGMVVWADSGRMIQILNNLLGNAAKFTHQGFIKISASWYDEQHQWAAIHVTDTGIGIPKQKLASIFLPFEQVDGSISRQYGGFGLGLSITQELVKAHGGELWVKSKEGKGSSFTFTLPSFTGQTQQSAQQPAAHQAGAAITAPVICTNSLGACSAAKVNGQVKAANGDAQGKQGDPAAEDDSCASEEYTSELPYDAAQLSALASSKPFTASPAATAGASSGNSQSATNARSGRMASSSAPAKRDVRPTQFVRTGRYQILSVDDDQVNQTVVQSLLSSTGYEVVTLSSGRQMLDYLHECEVLPDLILLDVMMPDMSGPEVCAQLARRPTSLPVPIIMVSAHTDEAVVVKGLDSGADDYITKPFRREEFLARIRAKLQLSSGVVVEQSLVGHPDEGDPLVMCVDDDEVNHIVLEGMLQSQNYRYLKARSGAEAMQLLDQSCSRPPHLVLLDASLPDTTGLDVLQQLRSRYSQVALPVVMLTARHNERAIVEALDTGANDYAVKPFRRSELLARIRMHLRSSQRAAAAAAEPADVGPVAAALAQADQDLSAELKQVVPAAEQLKTMPLLVAELSGLEEASAGLSPEQLSVLLGVIADTFDATVEKYAMLKVEATDNCLTVAAPLPSSTNNSSRSSMQQDQRPSGSFQELQQPALPDVIATPAQVTPLRAMLQQLLKLSQELLIALGLSDVQLGDQVQLGRTASSASSNPVQAQLPYCCKGVLQLRVALHVGGLHAGVVGARRPRYRLLGPALHLVKQAASAAPANSIVATDAAAVQLIALGMTVTQLGGPWRGADVASGSVGGGIDTKQLWLVGTALVGSCSSGTSSRAFGSCDPGGTAEDIEAAGQCQAPRKQQSPAGRPYLPSPAVPPQHRAAQHKQLELAQLPSLQQQSTWTSLLVKQQQQLMTLTAQLAAANGISGSTQAQPSSIGLGVSSWLDGVAALGLSATPAEVAGPPSTAAVVQPPCSDSHSSAAGSMNSKTATRSASYVSSASAEAQPLHQPWWGPLIGSMSADGGAWWHGQGCTTAGVEFAAALGALASWQLGPAEAQQILMIQQELDQVLQQLAAVTGGSMSCLPSSGCRADDNRPPCAANSWQMNKVAGPPAVCPPQAAPVAAAALAMAVGNRPLAATPPGDELHQEVVRSSSTSGQSSPPANSDSDSCRVDDPSSHTLGQISVWHPGSCQANATVGRPASEYLFRRCSLKQKNSAAQ